MREITASFRKLEIRELQKTARDDITSYKEVGEYLPKKDALRIIEECREKFNPL